MSWSAGYCPHWVLKNLPPLPQHGRLVTFLQTASFRTNMVRRSTWSTVLLFYFTRKHPWNISFLHKGFSQKRLLGHGSPLFHRRYHSPLRDACSELQLLPGETFTFNLYSEAHEWIQILAFLFSPRSVASEPRVQNSQSKDQTSGVGLWRSGRTRCLHTSFHEGEFVRKVNINFFRDELTIEIIINYN